MSNETHIHQSIALRLWAVVEEGVVEHRLRTRHLSSLLRLIADDLDAGLVRADRPDGKPPVLVAVPRPGGR
jgi:hypothetical protein